MHMETVHCGYPQPVPSGLGMMPLITPPATPTDSISQSCSSLDSDEGILYAKHEYVKPKYSDSSLLSVDDRLSPPNTPVMSPVSSPSPISQGRGRRTGANTTPPNISRSRKDSFVYDVRLTDEQFLFFVPDPDLVKSHLMFAVREEVEVLKEKIGELMERITQLEYENNVLRQYATQEALQQLQNQQKQNHCNT